MDNIEEYLHDRGQLDGQTDDFVDCALNILKNLHRHSFTKDEYKSYIPSILDLIESHQNTGGDVLEELF